MWFSNVYDLSSQTGSLYYSLLLITNEDIIKNSTFSNKIKYADILI